MSKRKKGPKARCYCRAKLRPKDSECRRCHRVTRKGMAVSLRKAAAAGPAFIGKSAARSAARPGAKVMCLSCGHEETPGGKLCSACTELMPGVPVPPMSDIGHPDMRKSAFADYVWTKLLGNSPASADRELLHKARHGRLNGGS